MSKPRNKTKQRRRHYLGVLAAAGLLTVGASPLLAQQVVAPGGTIGTYAGNVTVQGTSLFFLAPVDWNGNVSGELTFGSIYYDTPLSPAQAVVTVKGDSFAGSLSNTGDNAGVSIQVYDANLSIGGDITTTGSNIVIDVRTNRTFTQTAGTIGTADGEVVTVINAAGNNASSARLGTIFDGATLAVGNNVDITALASGGTSTIKGTTGTAANNVVTLNQAKLNLDATKVTELVVGGGAAEKVTILYFGDLDTTGNGGFKVGAAAGDGDSRFVMDGALDEVRGNGLEVGNGAVMSSLAGAGITVTDGTTTSTFSGVKGGTTNSIVGGGPGPGTKTTLNGDINTDPTNTNDTTLNVGNGTTAVKVVAAAGIIGGTTAADKTTVITVDAGSSFEQAGWTVTGYLVLSNKNPEADALTLGTLLNGTTLTTTDAITVADTAAGADNTVKGGGEFHFQNTGDGGTIKADGSSVRLAGAGTNLTVNLNSATGQSRLGVSDQATGAVTVGAVDVALNATHATTLAGGNNQALIIEEALAGNGDGKLVFDGTKGEVSLNGGFDLINDSTGRRAVDFSGDVFIDAAINKNLWADQINYAGGDFSFTGGPILSIRSTVNVSNDSAPGNVWNGTADTAFYTLIDDFNFGKAGQSTTFEINDGYQDTVRLNLKGDTIFNTDVNLVADMTKVAGVKNGIYVETKQPGAAMNVGSRAVINGAFSIAAGAANDPDNPVLIFDAGADYAQGGTAITANGNVSIAAGTVFDVANLNPAENVGFQVIDGPKAAGQWAHLSYAEGNGRTAVGDGSFYDLSGGYFNHYSKGVIDSALTGHPRYARPYLNSLADYNLAAAVDLGNSSNKDITRAMGNTLNAALMMINNPLDGIFRNNNNLHPQTENRLARSAGDGERFGLWLSPNASFRSVDGDYSQGYGDFNVKSYGVTLGFDGWVNDQLRLGLLAGVNSSQLDGDFEDIDGDDFQLGVYGQAFLLEGFRLNVGLAYSWQNYDAKRDIHNGFDPRLNQWIKSSFDGDTLIAAIELNKTFGLDYDMFLRPTIGYTYLGTSLDAYNEKSSLAAGSPWNLSQRVEEADFDLHLFRVGADLGWSVENAAVIGRAYYVGNAGDNQPSNTARFRYANAGVPSFNVHGAEYDDNMANLGLTVKVAPSDNTHFAIDYDTLLGSKSTTHNLNLTFNYEW